MKFNIKYITFLLGVWFFSSFTAQAQYDFYRKLYVNRMSLDEKVNKHMDKIPDILINAYRRGYVKGYYPMSPDIQQPFKNFAAKFGLQLQETDAIMKDFSCCYSGNAIGLSNTDDLSFLAQSTYANFDIVMELIEQKTFDKISGMEKYKPLYIRLIWYDINKTGLPDENAVLFKYEEVKGVLEEVKLTNPKNQATSLSANKNLELRNFSVYPVMISGQPVWSKADLLKKIKKSVNQTESYFEEK